jgi:predicted membrane protein
MVCGIASVTLCCTGVLSLPLGALGILFAILSRRLGKSMSPASIAGIVLSCTGIVFGLMTCGYLVYMILTDSDYRKAFEDSYEYYFEEYYDDSSSSIHYN